MAISKYIAGREIEIMNSRAVALVLSVPLILSALVLGYGCPIHVQPMYGIIVDNRLDEPILIRESVFLDGKWSEWYGHGEIDPKSSRIPFGMGPPTPEQTWRIEARTADGRVVASWELTRQQIIDRDYTLVVESAASPAAAP